MHLFKIQHQSSHNIIVREYYANIRAKDSVNNMARVGIGMINLYYKLRNEQDLKQKNKFIL